jgi:hypothetical protein
MKQQGAANSSGTRPRGAPAPPLRAESLAMTTRDRIQEIIDTGKATIAGGTNRVEQAQAGAALAFVACIALADALDELTERVAGLEGGDHGALEPASLGTQLADIRTELVKLNRAVKENKAVKKPKK